MNPTKVQAVALLMVCVITSFIGTAVPIAKQKPWNLSFSLLKVDPVTHLPVGLHIFLLNSSLRMIFPDVQRQITVMGSLYVEKGMGITAVLGRKVLCKGVL